MAIARDQAAHSPSVPDRFSIATSTAGLGAVLRKDLAVFALRPRLAAAAVFLLGAVQVVGAEDVYFLFSLAVACAMSAFVPAVEWHQETDPMLYSLPVRRTTVVLGRYVSSLAAGAAGLVAWVSAGWILRPLLAPDRTDPATWMTLEGVLTFALTFGLLTALFLPLYFRFGFGRGGLAFVGALPLVTFLGYSTADVAWGPAATGAGVSGLGVVTTFPPSALISSRVSALVAGIGPGWALAVIMVGMGVMLAFSERASVRGLRQREF